jgi:HK97 family phage prohead protease
LTGRLVPYDVVADVLDEKPDGGYDIYKEGFRRGAFSPQVTNGANNKAILTKIGLIHRHDGGLGYLGPFVGLREEKDGLWGDVMILPTKADDVGALLDAGIEELSIEFRLPPPDTHTSVDDSGIRWRTRAHLDQVALEPRGAYRTAQVLAYRTEVDTTAAVAAAAEAEQTRLATEAAEEQRRLETEANANLERRQRWDAMSGRLDREMSKQADLVRTYGFTRPPGR